MAPAMDVSANYSPLVVVSSVLQGNITPWWLFGAALSIYFVTSQGMTRVPKDTPSMGFHITMAFLFVLGCVWNTYHTPDQGPGFRNAHRFVGYLTMATGFISVVTGYEYILSGKASLDFSTAVLMMTVGAGQLLLQGLGLWYSIGIRRVRGVMWKDMHMLSMTCCFYMGCVLIGFNWLPKMITGAMLPGTQQANWTFFSCILGMGFSKVAVTYNRQKLDLRDKATSAVIHADAAARGA